MWTVSSIGAIIYSVSYGGGDNSLLCFSWTSWSILVVYVKVLLSSSQLSSVPGFSLSCFHFSLWLCLLEKLLYDQYLLDLWSVWTNQSVSVKIHESLFCLMKRSNMMLKRSTISREWYGGVHQLNTVDTLQLFCLFFASSEGLLRMDGLHAPSSAYSYHTLLFLLRLYLSCVLWLFYRLANR
jgi:hypothetical protein